MASIKKINVISRNPDHYLRDSKLDIHKFQRNYDPDLHPLQVAREYKLALNATKLERTFSKPFVGDLCHGESVSAMARHPDLLSCLFSGTYDGELNLWDARTRKQMWKVQAHNGVIWSITSDKDGVNLYSVGHDKAIKRWPYADIAIACDALHVAKGPGAANHLDEPSETWLCDTVVTKLSHHRTQPHFLSCGAQVLLWDASKKVPIRSFDWNDKDSALSGCSARDVAFNMVENNLFASCDENNNLVLYDIRAKDVKKLKMKHRLNSVCWNPMEAFILTAASEDYNAYTFDIRYMDRKDRILCTHMGHTAALTDLDYSPTGREFVTSSFDKSIRIFGVEDNRSRDVYHTKRMHKVSCVLWSGDDKFVYSGSADHNIRIWKARASEKIGLMTTREKNALDYSTELKEKFRHMPEIRRIARHRHVPRAILAAAKEHYRIRTSRARKEANVKLHSKPGVKVGETAVEKPVFGLQDEADVDPQQQKAEMRKLKKFADKVFKKEVNEEWKVREERRKKKKRFNKKETEENKTEEGKKTEEGNNEQVTKKKRGKKRKLSDSENI